MIVATFFFCRNCDYYYLFIYLLGLLCFLISAAFFDMVSSFLSIQSSHVKLYRKIRRANKCVGVDLGPVWIVFTSFALVNSNFEI